MALSEKLVHNVEPYAALMLGRTCLWFAILQPRKNKAINPSRNYMQFEFGEPNM
jgi:hypothetical protein